MEPDDLSDDLVRQAAGGSPEAAARLTDLLLPHVRAMVVVRLAPRRWLLPELDEVIQDVMLAMTASVQRMLTPSVIALRAYLSRVVTAKVADLHRARAARLEDPEAFRETAHRLGDNARLLWESISGARTPSSAAARLELQRDLMEDLAGLPEVDREIVTLAFFDQLATAEMGEVLGISRSAAAMRLQRAVEALRRRWNVRQGRDPAGGLPA